MLAYATICTKTTNGLTARSAGVQQAKLSTITTTITTTTGSPGGGTDMV